MRPRQSSSGFRSQDLRATGQRLRALRKQFRISPVSNFTTGFAAALREDMLVRVCADVCEGSEEKCNGLYTFLTSVYD